MYMFLALPSANEEGPVRTPEATDAHCKGHQPSKGAECASSERLLTSTTIPSSEIARDRKDRKGRRNQ